MKVDDIFAAVGTNGAYEGDGKNLSALMDFLVTADDVSVKELDALKSGHLIGAMYMMAKTNAGEYREAVVAILGQMEEWVKEDQG